MKDRYETHYHLAAEFLPVQENGTLVDNIQVCQAPADELAV